MLSSECRTILAALADAMEPARSRILIHDFVDPPTIGFDRPRVLDMLDLHMIASLNARLRNRGEWDALVHSVGGKLAIHQAWAGVDGSAVLEIRYVVDLEQVDPGVQGSRIDLRSSKSV